MTSHIRAYIQKISTASHRARNAPHARKNKHHPHPTPRRHVNQRRISIASTDPTPDQTRNPTATATATEATVMAEIAPYLYSEGQASHPVIELLPEHWRGGAARTEPTTEPSRGRWRPSPRASSSTSRGPASRPSTIPPPRYAGTSSPDSWRWPGPSGIGRPGSRSPSTRCRARPSPTCARSSE